MLGVFSVVGAAGSYVLPRSTPPAPVTAAHDSRGRKSTASKKREESEWRDGRPSTRGGDPRKLEMRTDGSGAGRTRVFTDPKQRCKAGTCRYDHADRPCYADPRERIELLFEMRRAAYKRILAQREDNAKWLRCKVEPFIQGAPRPAALAVGHRYPGEKFSATGLAQELQVELSLASRCHPPACIVVCVGHESSSPFPFSFSFRRPWFSRMDLVPLRFSGSRCLLQQDPS